MNIDVESVFNKCQDRSEAFKYKKVITQLDLLHNPFIINAIKIPTVKNFETSYYQELAKKKNISIEKLHENYWNELKGEFESSTADNETNKKYLLGILEKELFPEYFKYTNVLIKHYFTQDYSPNLFENSSQEITNTLEAFYIGDPLRVKKYIDKKIIGANLFDEKVNMNHQEFCSNAYEILLKIWDLHIKLTNIIEFHSRFINGDTSELNPIKEIPDYQNLSVPSNFTNNNEESANALNNKQPYDLLKMLIDNKKKYQIYENIYHSGTNTTWSDAHSQLREKFLNKMESHIVNEYINPDPNAFYQAFKKFDKKQKD